MYGFGVQCPTVVVGDGVCNCQSRVPSYLRVGRRGSRMGNTEKWCSRVVGLEELVRHRAGCGLSGPLNRAHPLINQSSIIQGPNLPDLLPVTLVNNDEEVLDNVWM